MEHNSQGEHTKTKGLYTSFMTLYLGRIFMDRHTITIEEMVGGYLIKQHNSFDKEGSFSMVVTDDKSVLECFINFLKEKYLIASEKQA